MYRTSPLIIENKAPQGEARRLRFVSGVRFALSRLIFPITAAIVYIIPYITALSPNSLGCTLPPKYLLFAAEEEWGGWI